MSLEGSQARLRKNLAALETGSPEAARRIALSAADRALSLRAARDGLAVPVLAKAGFERPLHSLVDPLREAERLLAAAKPRGFIIAMGLGAAYQIKGCLSSDETSGLLTVEHSAGMLRSLLESLDLSEVFSDPRFRLCVDPEPGELRCLLPSLYLPALAGGITSLQLRSRVELEPEAFARAARELREAIDDIADDYSVQSLFGELWFKNILRNVLALDRSLAETGKPPMPQASKAVVCAAGPSLDSQLAAIGEAKAAGAFIIATDASMGSLRDFGLSPDAVISIDCQRVVYGHFVGGLCAGSTLVLDLASPPLLARLGGSVRFFSSGHPLCAYLSEKFCRLPLLDTSGGNVTQAALSLAASLGAESCLLAGADFSCPEAKAYARGAFLFYRLAEQESRLAPLESAMTAYVLGNPGSESSEVRDEGGAPYFLYETPQLSAYRRRLMSYAAVSRMRILPMAGRGARPIALGGAAGLRGAAFKGGESDGGDSVGDDAAKVCAGFAQGRQLTSAKLFLENYAGSLRSLPEAREPVLTYMESLGQEQRKLWTTLLPLAAALGKKKSAGPYSDAFANPADCLNAAKARALDLIDETICGL